MTKVFMDLDELSEDYPAFGKKNRHCQLPDGSWVCLWVSTDRRFSEWSYFSIFPGTGIDEIPEARYRVYQAGTVPPDWRPMEPIEQIYRKTGVSDENHEEDYDREQVGGIGAAEKLLPGQYFLEAKVRVDDKDVELGTLAFKVK